MTGIQNWLKSVSITLAGASDQQHAFSSTNTYFTIHQKQGQIKSEVSKYDRCDKRYSINDRDSHHAIIRTVSHVSVSVFVSTIRYHVTVSTNVSITPPSSNSVKYNIFHHCALIGNSWGIQNRPCQLGSATLFGLDHFGISRCDGRWKYFLQFCFQIFSRDNNRSCDRPPVPPTLDKPCLCTAIPKGVSNRAKMD